MQELIEQLSERLKEAAELAKRSRKARQPILRAMGKPDLSTGGSRELNQDLASQAEETLRQLEAVVAAASELSQKVSAAQAAQAEEGPVKPEDLAGHFRTVVENAQRDARGQAAGEVGVSLKTLDIEVKGLIVVEQNEARVVTPTPTRGLDAGQLSTIRLKFGAVPVLQPSDLEPLPTADLSVKKTGEVTSAPANANWTVRFAIVVENKGPADAVNVIVNDEPDAASFVSASGFTTSQGKWAVTSPPKFEAQLGNLKVGQTVALSYVAETKPFHTFKSPASVRSDTIDPQPNDNSFTLELPAPPTGEKQADLVIMKTGAPSSSTAGTTVRYTITVRNNGPADAENVVVTDTPDRRAVEAVSDFSADPRGKWTQTQLPRPQAELGTLKVGESVTLKYRARLRDGVRQALNKAEVSSSTVDPTPSNNSDSFLINL